MYSIGKLYGFSGFRGTTQVFSGKIRSQHPVCMHSAEVDAFSGLYSENKFRLLSVKTNLLNLERMEGTMPNLSLPPAKER